MYPFAMNRKTRNTIGVILVVIGIIALLQFAFGDEKSEAYEHTVPLGEQVREIRIESNSLSLDINFVAGSSEQSSVRIEGQAAPEIVGRIKSARVENGVLHLRFKESWRWGLGLFNFTQWDEKQTVTVSLTDEAMASLESFKVNADSGSISVSGAAVREGEIETDSGSIRIGSLRGDAVTVRSDSGGIRVERFEGGSLSIRSDSGGIHAGTVSASLKAVSHSGGITIDHLNGVGEIKTDSGSIRVVKDDDTGMDVTSDSGIVQITVPASFSGSYDLKSDSGSIRHPDPVGASGEVIKVRTDSGSITIEQ